MAVQAGWSRLRSWLRQSNCAAAAPQQPKPEIPSHRPPFKPPHAAQPEVPSRPQLQPTPSSPSTSQPQPGAQTASRTSSQPQQATQSQQATKTASQPSYPAPTGQPQPPTQMALQRPSPSRTSPPQPSAQTSSKPPSLSRNSQLQQAPQTASQPPSPLHTSLPQKGAQTASQPPSPSHTASQPRAETWAASPSTPASGTESQLQPGTNAASQRQSPSHTTTGSQTAIRSTSKTATPASTASQARPEAQITSQNLSPSPLSQLQPATTVSKPPSPSQTDVKQQPATRTISQPPSPSRTVSKTKTPGNIKDRSTKSKTNLKSSASPGEQAALLQKEIREGVSRFIQKLDVGNPKQPGNQQSVSVITFVGENRGASMTAGPNAVDKDSYMYIHRDYKVNKEDEDEVSRDKDGNSKGRSDRRSGSQPMPTCINNNVQSINNSLMYNSSCSERNPGVHLVLSIKPTQPIIMPQEKMETSEAQKAKLNTTPPQQLKSEPTVRRRCLRGLFMESESDQDNPQKPRRHGCRYRCPDEKKGKEGKK